MFLCIIVLSCSACIRQEEWAFFWNILTFEDEGAAFLQNVRKHLPIETVSYPRRPTCSEQCENHKSCMKLPYLSTLHWRHMWEVGRTLELHVSFCWVWLKQIMKTSEVRFGRGVSSRWSCSNHLVTVCNKKIILWVCHKFCDIWNKTFQALDMLNLILGVILDVLWMCAQLSMCWNHSPAFRLQSKSLLTF